MRSVPDIYEIRDIGRDFCQTDGSEHYKNKGDIEPAEMIISNGLAEDWILGNIIKYASRYKKSQSLNDLKKISDYAHILTGIKILDGGQISNDKKAAINNNNHATPGGVRVVDGSPGGY